MTTGRLPFVLTVGLVSVGLAALFVLPRPYPHEPPIYGLLAFMAIFALALPICVSRMSLFVSRWTALYILATTAVIPGLAPIIGTANRSIWLSVYIAAVVGVYLLTKWVLRSTQG